MIATVVTGCPLVSIIIITYNDRKNIGEAIDSALMQNYPNCEVIVVDDGSFDGTGNFIAERYDNRVQYCWKENGGQGSARNRGLQMASGKYIQNLDSDDLLLPDKIKNQVNFLEEHPDVAFVYGRTLCFFDDDRSHTWEHPVKTRACSGNLLKDILQNGNFINIGQPLIRHLWVDRISGFDPSIRDADDYDFILRLAYAGATGQFQDEVVYLYRHRRNPFDPSEVSARHSSIGQMRGEVYLLEKMYSIMQHDAHIDLYLLKHRLGDAYFQLGWILFGHGGDRKEALHHIVQGLRSNQERWAYKLVVLTAAAFLPGPKLRELRLRIKAVFRKPKEAKQRYDVVPSHSKDSEKMTMESKLRICVVRGLLDSVSMTQYADQLVESVRHYAPDVSVTELSPSLPTWLKGGAYIEKIAAFVYRYLFYPWHIRNLQADIFHITNHSHAHLIIGLDAHRTIVTCHDLIGVVHPENIRGTARLPLVSESAYRYSVGFLQRAVRIIVDSENTKRDVLRLIQCQIGQVQVIYLGLAPIFQVRTNALDMQAFKRDHGIENCLLMLHVGSNIPYKNIAGVFETLDILNHKFGLDVKLVKVGLPFTDEQEHLIRQRGLGNQIIHLGHLPPADLVRAYQSCDVMLFPSLYEGFGWPPLEAMACGLPVVASNAGSLAEVLGDAALLISPNDYTALSQAVAAVLSNSQLRQELIDKGLARARQFTREKSTMELMEVYRQVRIEAQSRLT